ncbi:helix-turn-helix domain-containing protein [uncultured Croceitalea sp.]|uniref:helix-turn-helix domain-containing protein n=1 Tax=uncultured Croceitalea sp. TaxID=1798908 RepID=UPI003305CBD4
MSFFFFFITLYLLLQDNTATIDSIFQDRSFANADGFFSKTGNWKGFDTTTGSNGKLIKWSTVYRDSALYYAKLNKTVIATTYVEKYLAEEFDTSLLFDSAFDNIRDTREYRILKQKYTIRNDTLSFTYLLVAVVGFYIALSLNFKRRKEVIAHLLVSGFIFIYSYFIFCLYLNISNYNYLYPNLYLVSAAFLFLYGPLLYFYFKRITQKYIFKRIDVLHLLPTALLWVYITPMYMSSNKEKLAIVLSTANNEDYPTYTNSTAILMLIKLCSMIFYGYLIYRTCVKGKQNPTLNDQSKKWQKNITVIYFVYVVVYAVYVLFYASGNIFGILYHLQTLALILMVAYIAYSVNVQPKVFSGMYAYNLLLVSKKYHNSGLTIELSKELKEKLLLLFEVEKVYKQNDISLGEIAQMLNTNRHNASQLINEQFHMTFHELINSYRIKEAKKLLNNKSNGYKIINIAYEVGYNNKATFNKAFKKNTHVTPSEYQQMSAKY